MRIKETFLYKFGSRVKTKIKNLLCPWGTFYGFVVMPVKVFIKKYIYCPEISKQLRKLKDSHINERCFIVATGPSLTIEDVQKLKNEKTFFMNSSFKLYSQLDWRPTFYSILEPPLTQRIIDNNDIDFNDFATEYCFFNRLSRKIVKCDKAMFIELNWLDHIRKYGESKLFKYEPDLSLVCYDYYSSTQQLINIAMYMGFKKIYIIGADNDYLSGKQHFAECKGEPPMEYQLALKSQTANDLGYEYIGKIAKDKGVKIFNTTRGGKVKPFPRVDLDDVLEKNL